LAKGNIPNLAGALALERDKHYVKIRLNAMRIANTRVAWKKYYGCVHTHTTLADLRTGHAEFHSVSTPAKLAGPDPKNADRILLVDLPVVGPVPYRGGDITLEIGLFAVQSSDLADSFLEVLKTMSKAGGVSFVEAAAPFIQPLKQGAERLFGLQEHSTLITGVARGFPAVQTGSYLVTNAPSALVEPAKLHLDENYRIMPASHPLNSYAYLVFSIEAGTEREDWAAIPDLRRAHETLQSLLKDKKTTQSKAEEAYAFFRRLAITSPDLIRADADELVRKENAKLQDAFGATRTVAARKRGVDIGSFADLDLYGKQAGRR
jgi:hypothetical protein